LLDRAESEDPGACFKILSNSLFSGCLIRDSILLFSEAERCPGFESEGRGVEDSPGELNYSII